MDSQAINCDSTELLMLQQMYDLPPDVLKTSGLSYGEIDRRLTRAQTDVGSPDSYKIGWRNTCDVIVKNDDCGELLEYAQNQILIEESERYRAFLFDEQWPDPKRRNLAEWHGRHDCSECASRYLYFVDNEISALLLAKILRRHNSQTSMRELITEKRSIAEADHRLCVIGGAA